MASAPSLSVGRIRNTPWNTGLIVSISVHCFVLVGIPVLLTLTKSTVHYARPPTFQLISTPPSLKPIKPKLQKPRPKTRAPKKTSRREVPSKSAPREENIEELASLLEDIPSPATVAAVGNFKYNWYLAQVQEKVERNWNPSTGSRNDSVVVAFTIRSDGSISEPAIYKKSANATLNELALRAVSLAAPFSKLPPGVPENKYDMLCTLRPARK